MKEFFKNIICGEIAIRFFLPFELKKRESFPPALLEDYLKWVNYEAMGFVHEFMEAEKLSDSNFIKGLNRVFQTQRFNIFLGGSLMEYMLKIFSFLGDHALLKVQQIVLEDNPIHRFCVKKFLEKFKIQPHIQWKKVHWPERLFQITCNAAVCLGISLNSGLFWGKRKRRFKILREALWGLNHHHRNYFRDDFIVDHHKIQQHDLLLFSRGFPRESGRLNGYLDAKSSGYEHFDLKKISLGIGPLLQRVIPKYLVAGHSLLLGEWNSPYFTWYRALMLNFFIFALPYEKIFTHYEIISHLGHNFSSTHHIAEAIICENHGTRYYLMHWSDMSIESYHWVVSFLGCDQFLVWGEKHLADPQMPHVKTGYVFKGMIKKAIHEKDSLKSEMNLPVHRKIVTFFDESFTDLCQMTPSHFVNLWKAALHFAVTHPQVTVVVKSKDFDRVQLLPTTLKEKFAEIQQQAQGLANFYIFNSKKYSFIEAIGISDVVITQGMTSSATIAIIFGVEGLYFDQVPYRHPFTKDFKDKIVFDDSKKLCVMVEKILEGRESPRRAIPEKLLRGYDAYDDDRGLDIFRDVLTGKFQETPQREAADAIV